MSFQNKKIEYLVIDGTRLQAYYDLPTAYATPNRFEWDIDLCGDDIKDVCGNYSIGGYIVSMLDAPQIIVGYGSAPVPFDISLIHAAQAECNVTVLEPIIVNALNCDNTTTPVEVSQRVSIVAEQPIKVCFDGLTENVVYEKYCDITTGDVVGYAVLETTETVPPTTTVKWFDVAFAPIGGQPANSKVCSVMDIETVTNCFQDVTDPTIRYSASVLINTSVTPPVSIGTIWTDGTGAIVAAPANIQPCVNTQLNLVVSNWLPLCVDGVQWYVREAQVVDSNLGAATITTKEYKQGANGAIVTTAPTGTAISEGVCIVPETTFFEREVCITIDGSTESYEVIKVYTRDQTTGVSTLIHYETKAGAILTGTIVEVCCTCESLCDVPIVSLNRVCFAYSGSFNGDTQFPGDKANLGADIFIEYFEVDGNVLVNTQTAIGNTGVATFSDAGYGIAYDNIVTLLNTSILGANDLEFVPAGNALPDRGWGVKYNDAKSYRIVLSDFIPNSGVKAYWTIVINPTEQWDGLGDARSGNHWTYVDFQSNIGAAVNFVSCASL